MRSTESTEPQKIELHISRVWLGQDLRGRPMTKYKLEDKDGNFVGVFNTPITSRLSDELWNESRRNNVR